jgi:hypothetical protein
MSENPDNPKLDDAGPRQNARPIEIHPDRSRKARSMMLFSICLLATGGLFTWLLMRFTGSSLLALGLAGGMLAYMLIVAVWTSHNLRSPGE